MRRRSAESSRTSGGYSPHWRDRSLIKALTFDLYGTLVDWEAVWVRVANGFLKERGAKVGPGEFCREWKALVLEMGGKKYERYKLLIGKALVELFRKYGIPGGEGDAMPLIAAWGEIRPFADVNDALRELKVKFKLAILSNSDDDLIQAVLPGMPPVFDHVITAEDVGAYKPDRKMYSAAVERLGGEGSEVMHVARSQYDVKAALDYGMEGTWVNRAGEAWQYGARPRNTVNDIQELVSLLSRTGA